MLVNAHEMQRHVIFTGGVNGSSGPPGIRRDALVGGVVLGGVPRGGGDGGVAAVGIQRLVRGS